MNSELNNKPISFYEKISYFFIFFVLIIGCAKGQNKENLNTLRDSLDKMVLEGRKDGAWRNARSCPAKRNTRGAGNRNLRGKSHHHSQLRLPQLPSNHALLPLQCEKRQPHPTRARSSQMAHARRAKLREVASGG